MNSGKSTALIQVAHNYEERGMNVLILKPSIDSKGGDKVVSRLGVSRNVDITADKNMNAYSAVQQWHKDVDKIDCVLVDEAQLLQQEQIDQLFNLSVYDNIPVICYGLRTDFKTRLFPASKRLFALAHSIEELKTICRCGSKAMLNARKSGDQFTFSGDQVAIDGVSETSYESLCGKCYFDELANSAVVD